MKALIEKRNDLLEEMEGLTSKAKEETRALIDAEISRFEDIKKEISNIDSTLKIEEEQRGMEKMTEVVKVEEVKEDRSLVEERDFVTMIRENRAGSLGVGTNGQIIPSTIADRIIEKVKELSPLLSKVSMFHVNGALKFPKVATEMTAGYQGAEFDELLATDMTFGTVDLGGFVIGAQTKISKTLINNSQFDIASYAVNAIAQAVAFFLEKELIVGTAGKMEGVLSAPQTKALAVAGTLTIDELIQSQLKVPASLQGGASWLMHPETVGAVRKLQNASGDSLVSGHVEGGFGYRLLGKEILVSESMPKLDAVAGTKSIAYGDFSGLYVNMKQNVEVQVLTEKYATQHAIGLVTSVELDSKIVEDQKIVVIKNA